MFRVPELQRLFTCHVVDWQPGQTNIKNPEYIYLLLMIQILHYLKDPKLWELWNTMEYSLLWVMQDLYRRIVPVRRLTMVSEVPPRSDGSLHDPESGASLP